MAATRATESLNDWILSMVVTVYSLLFMQEKLAIVQSELSKKFFLDLNLSD